MADAEHHHPGQEEPRAHGEIHHEDRIVDLNTADEATLASLPMVGPARARALVQARPFRSWEQMAEVPGIGLGMIDDLKSGGAQLGRPR